MSRNPLFQVMLVLQNQPRKALEVATGLTFVSEDVDTGTAKFDLTLFCWETEDRIAGLLEHNADLFDRTTAQRLFHHFERLLEAAVEEPGQSLLEMPLLSAAERHHLVVEWNERGPGGEGLRCVHHQVERQARETPAAPAALFEDRLLTYRDLNTSANRLAHGLRRLGVGPEVLVGICVERSLEMVTALLAVLKAGGAAVALDPAYPADRLALIVRDARMPVLLTQTPLAGLFPGCAGTTVLCLDGGELFPDESPDDPQSRVMPDHPMYAIYTSGTTGQPKGIVVPHRAFANLLAWQRDGAGLAPRARTAQLATFGFCVSFQEIFASWCAGSTLVVASEMTRRDLAGLGGFLAAGQVERLHLPFAALKHFAEAVASEDPIPGLGGLREVITAGEQLQVTPAVRALFERLPGCSLHNQYGASETHVVSALALTGAPDGWPVLPAVGRPIANVRIHLLDAALEPVPVNVPGELYAGGACLARGYLNDPVLTAQKLIPDPFATLRGEPGARLYRTGDQARYRADGRIEYHGRIDGQVKIRGFRVELGEIETALARHPAVRDAAVLALPDPAGPRLVAWVVPAAEMEDSPFFDELRLFLKRTLPEPMIPAGFVRIEALPLNANGKLDPTALPVPDSASLGRRAAFVAPRSAVEEVLAGLWSDVLGVDRVGVHDNFFALGGHSLLATQLASRVRGTFRVELPLRRLFETADLAGLAAAVVVLEAQPGQSEAIARVLQRIRSMSPAEKQEALSR